MSKEDIRRAAMLVMLTLLVLTAPQWLLHPQQHLSQYDAPWVYPSLAPTAANPQ